MQLFSTDPSSTIDESNVYFALEHTGQFASDADIRAEVELWAATTLTTDACIDYIEAKCFDADAAVRLAEAGITPGQASTETATDSGYNETIAYQVANGDMSVKLAIVLARPGLGADISTLGQEAGQHGDQAQVELCRASRDGDSEATLACARAILSGQG